MKTAIIYARVSDRRQAEEDVSVPSQIELGHKKAAQELDATVLRTFADLGRSGFKEGGRAEFTAAVDFATTMGVDFFICWSSSRFARNRFECAIYKRQLERAGVRLVYLSSNIDVSTDEGWIADAMFELVDEMTSRNISKDTKRSMIRNAQMGYFCGGKPPFGFSSEPDQADPKRRRLVVIDSEAVIVRRIFALRARGLGAYQITVTFNDEGVPYRNSRWSKKTVLTILRNPVAIGMTCFNRTDSRRKVARPRAEWVMVESHPPIVDRAVFDRVQEMMDAATEQTESGSPKSTHAFTGILRCAACGGGMVVETGKGRRGTLYSYYRCRRVRQGEDCTAGQRYRADKVDGWLSDVILARVLSPENLQEIMCEISAAADSWGKERSDRSRQIKREIADLQARNSRLFDLLELHGKDAPNLGDLTARLRGNNERVKVLEAELSALAMPGPTAPSLPVRELSGFLRGLLMNPENAARARTFYASFIRGIRIGADEAAIEYDPAKLTATAPGGCVTWSGSQSLEVASRWFQIANRTVYVPVLEGLWSSSRRFKGANHGQDGSASGGVQVLEDAAQFVGVRVQG